MTMQSRPRLDFRAEEAGVGFAKRFATARGQIDKCWRELSGMGVFVFLPLLQPEAKLLSDSGGTRNRIWQKTGLHLNPFKSRR